ncbi:MAG: YqaJ viral recombinase family protein [Flavobacteriaceae bacterium]|nr:YqaJ viral recombinase family protein [Flavobacteriaceae bacterium]
MDWLDEIGMDAPFEEMDHLEGFEENEWETQRLGMVTGSNFSKLVKKSKDRKSYQLSDSKTASDLIYKIAWERLLKKGNISNGLGRLNVSSREMQHGNDYEGAALLKFQEATGLEVNPNTGFHQLDEWIGGTPDAFVGEDAIVEVKCPWNGGNHLYSLLNGVVYNDDHMYQMQGYLWITGRKTCYFVTYDPDLIEELQLNIIEVGRDEEMIKGIETVMQEVKNKISEIIENEKLKQ